MVITLSQELEFIFPGNGYGSYRMTLPQGTQDVDSNLGLYLLSTYKDTVTQGSAKLAEPEVAVVEEAPVAPAEPEVEVPSENAEVAAPQEDSEKVSKK